jgi:hypothetical protein
VKACLVFFCKGGRIGSVERTDENIREAHRQMYLSLIQKDITGTLNYNVLGVKGRRKPASMSISEFFYL